jgi:hypothetical protein
VPLTTSVRHIHLLPSGTHKESLKFTQRLRYVSAATLDCRDMPSGNAHKIKVEYRGFARKMREFVTMASSTHQYYCVRKSFRSRNRDYAAFLSKT